MQASTFFLTLDKHTIKHHFISETIYLVFHCVKSFGTTSHLALMAISWCDF